jgi:hypothetical protein
MKFGKVVDARRAIWERLLSELEHTVDLGALEDECEDEFDLRRMARAIEQVKVSLQRRLRATGPKLK